MRCNIFVIPERRRDRLVAHLLGHRDAVFLHLAVGVIGTGADPQPLAVTKQDELRFTARRFAEHLDGFIGGEPRRRGAIEDRHARRALDAERFEFGDVLFQRRFVAAGPAGDHQPVDLDIAAARAGLAMKYERQNTRRHLKPPGDTKTCVDWRRIAIDWGALYMG